MISEKANIGKDTEIGHNCIILDNTVIGDNCKIGHNVIIHEGSKIGDGVRIDDNTIIGKTPMFSPRSIFKTEKKFEPAVIGNDCLIGANVVIYVQCKIGMKNLIADMATIRENVTIGDYNIVGRGAAIENFCTIGNRNKFETNSYITAYSNVEDYCFVAPGTCTSNDNYMGRDPERYKHFKGVTIKTGGRIGVNATILPGVVIAEDTMIAGGAVVTRNTEPGKIYAGVPAMFFGDVPEAQLLKNNKDKK